MSAIDPYRVTDQFGSTSLQAIVTRLEVRGEHPYFAKMLEDYLDAMHVDTANSVLPNWSVTRYGSMALMSASVAANCCSAPRPSSIQDRAGRAFGSRCLRTTSASRPPPTARMSPISLFGHTSPSVGNSRVRFWLYPDLPGVPKVGPVYPGLPTREAHPANVRV